ncbi:glycosyltransferase family 2 protein [Candidatus Pelagibacter ubique]|nr:glycosyltransferase family 2 protein [Candidatus Pelagibacter ubique]
MNLKNPSVGIVVLSWNDWKNTSKLLESIFKSNYNNYDIIVVDNNSNNENFEGLINWCKSKKIKINRINFKPKSRDNKKNRKNLYIYRITEIADIPFAKNLGVARGYNKGINFALKNNYDFIVKLDCDFLVTKNFISGMVQTLKDNRNAATVSPKVYYYLNKKTKIIWWKGLNFSKNYFRLQRTGKGSDRRILDKGQFKGLIKTDSICGCCVMFRSKILKKVGQLDEDFFFGPEDIEHSNRIKKYGELLVNLDHHTYHKVSQSIFVSGIKARYYFETIGWLLIIKKMCNTKDKIIGQLYFIIRGFSHFLRLLYKKDKDPHIGFLLGLKDFFLKY